MEVVLLDVSGVYDDSQLIRAVTNFWIQIRSVGIMDNPRTGSRLMNSREVACFASLSPVILHYIRSI